MHLFGEGIPLKEARLLFFVRQRLQHRFFRSGAYRRDHAEHQQQDAAQGQLRQSLPQQEGIQQSGQGFEDDKRAEDHRRQPLAGNIPA